MERPGYARCVLVVDDDETISEVLKEALVQQGLAVRCAVSVDVASKFLCSERIDVVVLDLLLRGELGERVGELAWGLGVPVVRMSGHPQKIEEECRSQHVFLQKPFRLHELVAAINLALGTLPT